MAELTFDHVVEEILIRLDAEDLIRFKSVCKSWKSFISSPHFVKAHLKHAQNKDLNNRELGHRRIGMGISTDEDDERGYFYNGKSITEHGRFVDYVCLRVVGSCNGLVCLCPQDADFVVTNPSTREQIFLPMLFDPKFWYKKIIHKRSCWGFGYDSSTDDYKVVVGFSERMYVMDFYVLTLKSNTWRSIGEVEYQYAEGISGILWGEALHWFLDDLDEKVIMSLNLSTEEFKEIPQPVDEEYDYIDRGYYKLGVICIFLDHYCFSSKKWVMKNKWERYINGHCENKYDVAHGINTTLMSSRVTDLMYPGLPYLYGISGILCGGALHWFLIKEDEQVIISLNLSTEEFKEIPQPEDKEYKCGYLDYYKLGVIEGCLCVFLDRYRMKWVMKNNKWERYNNGDCENKYDVAHGINTSLMSSRATDRMYPRLLYLYGVTDGEHVSSGGSYIRANIFVKSLGSYIRANIFVKSLVSPYPPHSAARERIEGINAETNIRK